MNRKLHLSALAFLACTAATPGHATEKGLGVYQPGSENFGCCNPPPPGWYALFYATDYRATHLRDDAGDDVLAPTGMGPHGPTGFARLPFKLAVDTLTTRLLYVLPTQVAGAEVALHAIVPLVRAHNTVGGGGTIVPVQSQTKSGLGDAFFGIGMGWHMTPEFSTVAGIDVAAPTGSYDKADLVNTGVNHWAGELVYGMSYLHPGGFAGDAKLVYLVNATNHATDYRSGQEFDVDYAAGWAASPGLVLGVGGYLYHQLTDDRQGGAVVNGNGNRGRAFAVGPSMRYDFGKGGFATLKYQFESGVHDRTEGHRLWLKVVTRF